MNTGQTLLATGALALLSLIILRVNSGFLSTNNTLQDTKFGLLGVSLATSVIEEACGLAFDELSKDDALTGTDELTISSALGPEVGESYADFDDFDDFDGFAKVDSTMPSAMFNISAEVDYITPGNPDISSGSRTWHKKITVIVTSKSMTDTIKMSSIYSYWYFR